MMSPKKVSAPANVGFFRTAVLKRWLVPPSGVIELCCEVTKILGYVGMIFITFYCLDVEPPAPLSPYFAAVANEGEMLIPVEGRC